jgi:putative transposase
MHLVRRPTLPHPCGAGALARERPVGPRIPFWSRLVEHVHWSLTRNPAAVISRMGVAGEGARPTFTFTFRPMSTSVPPPTKYCYCRRLPHLQKADAALFVTFCTGAHLILPGPARDLVLEQGLREGGLRPLAGGGAPATPPPRIHLYAAVVMPDHVHLLFLALRDENGWPFAVVDILQCLKSATAHRINKLFHLSGPVWEEESFDHVLRSDESLQNKCEYIRQNPVKAGLVQKPEDYRWLWVAPELITE